MSALGVKFTTSRATPSQVSCKSSFSPQPACVHCGTGFAADSSGPEGGFMISEAEDLLFEESRLLVAQEQNLGIAPDSCPM